MRGKLAESGWYFFIKERGQFYYQRYSKIKPRNGECFMKECVHIYKTFHLAQFIYCNGMQLLSCIFTRVGNLPIRFSSDPFICCEQKSKKAIRSWKRVHRCHRSFVKSDGSKSLTVAILFRATWAINSRSLFKISNWGKSWVGNLLFHSFTLHSFAQNCSN